MKRFVYFLMVIALLLGCSGRREQMSALLDRADSLNRAYVPMTGGLDSLLLEAADYYDRHGTPNEQMRAHYLLGCAYRDMGEAPQALQCYQDAVDCADTLASDCDYRRLARVCGQMAFVFYQQGLFREQLKYGRLSAKYAWEGKDTLAFLMSKEQDFLAYNGLGLIDSAIMAIEDVAQKYQDCGMKQNSAISLGLAIKPLIDKGNYNKARMYMEIYESKSGRFDSLGNIVAGREIYYGVKGFYYLYTNKYDSAEYFFLKELRDGKDFNNQDAGAKGLAELYHRLHYPDSVVKYSMYAYAMSDSIYARRTTKEVKRIQSMYDYTRHQRIAYQEQEKANQFAKIIWICVGIIIVTSLLTFIIIRELTNKKKEVEKKFMQSQFVLEQAQSDIARLLYNAEANRELISEKEQIIREQETIMKSLLQRDTNSKSLADSRLKESAIYGRFEQLSVVGQKPTNVEWKQIEEQLFKCFPGFKGFMSKNQLQLNDKEYKTCLLIRVGFKPKTVSHMLEVDPSYISNIRAEMLQKLFNLSRNSKAFDKMLKEIY